MLNISWKGDLTKVRRDRIGAGEGDSAESGKIAVSCDSLEEV
jgi:hypothetical protein